MDTGVYVRKTAEEERQAREETSGTGSPDLGGPLVTEIPLETGSPDAEFVILLRPEVGLSVGRALPPGRENPPRQPEYSSPNVKGVRSIMILLLCQPWPSLLQKEERRQHRRPAVP